MDHIKLEQTIKPDQITAYEQDGTQFDISTKGSVRLKIHFVRPDIVRFRYAASGDFERDFSYALTDFIPQEHEVRVEDQPKYLALISSKIKVEIRKKSLRIRVYDLEGNLINDEKRVRFEENIFHGVVFSNNG